MLYFDTLPKILMDDQNGNPILLTNLVSRAALIEELKNNPMLFYKYTIQEGDTPEIVAEKYYGDAYRYWIVLYSNELMDPVWDWPLTSIQFSNYIDSKYSAQATEANMTAFEYTNSTIKYYQKIVKKSNTYSEETSEEKFDITEEEYNTLVENTQYYELSNTDNCTVTTTKQALSIYDYEYELNESKREIKLLNSQYASSFEETFNNLMV